MKALSLALISVLFASACAKEPETSAVASAETKSPAPTRTEFLFTLATCLPPAESVYGDTKRLIFLANLGDDGQGPLDLMFETEPSVDSNNDLGFFVAKGGDVRIENAAWATSISIVSDSGVMNVSASMPANVPGEQLIGITFANEQMTVVETWTCRVH